MIDLAERTVRTVLETGTRERPNKTAVVDETGSLTYAQLHQHSLRVAGGLQALGIGEHDSVAMMLDNSIDHVLTWFGASSLNARQVAINTGVRPAQLAQVVEHSEARVLVIDERYLDVVRAASAELTTVQTVVVRGDVATARALPYQVIGFDDLARAAPAAPANLGPQDILGIVYTSGTTGMPKGVLVSQAQTYGRMWPGGVGSATEEDRTLVVLPLFHVIGQCRGLYNTLIAGGTAVLERRFSASRFWTIARDHEITFAPLVGVMASYLLDQPARPDDRVHSVRHIAFGTTTSRLEEFRNRFGIEELTMSYGLTEAGGVLVAPAEPVGCGFVRPDFEARLVDAHDVEVEPGSPGELVLRPTEPWTTMLGYFKRPDLTTERWRNLWLHTGDVMRQRADGMFVFEGRASDRIRVRGENVAPAEVEAVAIEHPEVVDCVAVGVAAPDGDAAVGEQAILLVVVPVAGAQVDFGTLDSFLAERLPTFAVPRFIHAVDALPRTEATQRVQRNVLAELPVGSFWDRQSPDGSNQFTLSKEVL